MIWMDVREIRTLGLFSNNMGRSQLSVDELRNARGRSAHCAGPQYCSFEMQIEKHEMQISLKAIVCSTIHYRSVRFHFLYLLRTPESGHFPNTCCTLLEFAELWN